MKSDFYEKLAELIQKDRRYRLEAYTFLFQALSYTQLMLKRSGHVSGKELLEGIRQYTLKEYGPLARRVLEHWGIKRTDDFGEIVFNLIENNLLRKAKQDTKEDFKNGYDFHEAFDKAYRTELEKELKKIK